MKRTMKLVAIIFEYLFFGFTTKNPYGVMEQLSCGKLIGYDF